MTHRVGAALATGTLLAVLVAGPVTGTAVASPASPDPGPKVAFHLHDHRIDEASGMAAGRRHPGVVYLVNDSGGTPQVFAVDSHGHTTAVLTLAGATNRDWEALAIGPGPSGEPSIFVGDIGDNLGGTWPSVHVYRFPEPRTLRSQVVRPTRYTLTYADGARNAEAMLVDPRTGRLYVVSKQVSGGVYAAPKHLHGGINVLHKVASAPLLSTGAAYAPDGSSLVIRTYFSAELYSRIGHRKRVLAVPLQRQGESVTYTADGSALLLASEGTGTAVWRVPLPSKPHPSPTATRPPGASPPAHQDDPSATGTGRTILLAAIGAAVLILGFTAVRRRRPR